MRRVLACCLAAVLGGLLYACGDSLTGPTPRLPSEVPTAEDSPVRDDVAHTSVDPAKVCGDETIVDLAGNQGLVVGTVTVSNDDNEATVVYRTTGDWELVETHLAVTTSVSEVPTSSSGLPKIGGFPEKATHEPWTTAFAVTLSLADLGVGEGDDLVVAAHADVIDRNDAGDPEDDQEEGAWGEGIAFNQRGQGNTASYFEHTVQPCTSVAQTVGSEGGTIEVEGDSPDEGVTLVIPEGALEEPVEITIEPVALTEPSGTASSSFSTDDLIEGTGYDFGPDGLEFLEPVELIIGYDEANLGSEPEAVEKLLHVFIVNGIFEPIVPSTVDADANEVSAFVEHFTVFAVGTVEGIDITVTEQIGVTDQVTVRGTGRLAVDEPITVTDNVSLTVERPISVSVDEPITVTDNVSLTVESPTSVSVDEPISVTDNVSLTVESAPSGSFAYVALRGADSVSVLDRDTNTILATLSVGQFPFAVAVRPDGSEVYVTNRGDGSVSMIDVATQSVVATIDSVARDPIDVAFSPDGSTAYVVDNNTSRIGVIDAATRTLTTQFTGTTRFARAIALTASGDTAFVAANDSLVAFDLMAGSAVDTVSGTFSSADARLTPDGTELWVTDSPDDEVLVFDRATLGITTTIGGILAPQGIDIDGAGTTAYVADGGSAVTPIDIATRTVGASIGLSFEPDWLAVSVDGSRAYVSAGRLGTELAVIDLTTGSVITTLTVGSSPGEVGLTP